MSTKVSGVLAAAANRIERCGWASRAHHPGMPLSDAIALEALEVPAPDSTRAALLAAAFVALERRVGADCFSDWLRDPTRTQAEVIAALRGAAEQTAQSSTLSITERTSS